MSASIHLQIADENSPEAIRGKVMYRYTDGDGVASSQLVAPAAIQATLKSLFETGEGAALDESKAEAEAKAADLAAKRAEFDARVAG